MNLLENREWPAELRAELEREVKAIPAKEMMSAAELPQICPNGFRKDPKNVPMFRRNLTAALLGADVPERVFEFFRHHSFYQDFVCVLSTVALKVGFEAMAAFTGGAKLVLGMLADPRAEVRQKALEFLDSGEPFPPVPDNPDEARNRLAETFEPFVKAFSSVAVAQNVTVVNREEDDRKLIATLQEDLRRSRDARTAAENAQREAERRADVAERRNRAFEDERKTWTEAAFAAESARDAAIAARESAEAERDTAKAESERMRIKMRDLVAFREECFQRREKTGELEEQRAALVDECRRLEAELERLGDQQREAARETLSAFVNAAPIPTPPPTRTLRERLADAVHSEPPSARRRLRLLIDGHNVINLVPAFANRIGVDSHETIRDAFVERLVAVQPQFGVCETEIYFDGAIRNDYNPGRNVRVHYSGGVGDHKADRAILDLLEFYLEAGDYCVVITEDGDFRSEALSLGSRVIGSRDFMDLLG